MFTPADGSRRFPRRFTSGKAAIVSLRLSRLAVVMPALRQRARQKTASCLAIKAVRSGMRIFSPRQHELVSAAISIWSGYRQRKFAATSTDFIATSRHVT